MENVRNLIQRFCDLNTGEKIAIISVIVAIIGIIVKAFIQLLVYYLQKRDNKTKEKEEEKVEKVEKVEKTLHYLTKSPMEADFTNVIGRKEDLRKLWKKLSEHQHSHVVLTGFGGIGKTKLTQLLFHEYEKEFEEVAWIDYQGNLKDSILSCVNMFQEIQDKEERWKAVVTALNNDPKKKLFIIDNVDNTTSQHPEQDEELRDLTGWKNTTLLLTSRMERLTGFENIALDELELENCVKVFEHYYTSKHPKRETVVKLIELANGHPLTIELLAKGAGREDLDDYCQKLIANGFEKIDRKTVTDRNKVNAKIEEHLKNLFDMQQRSEEDKKVLNSFAILPEQCQCSLAEVEQWLGFKDFDLDEVIKDGWLSYDKENKKYSLHPLVRTIIRFDFTEDAQNEKNIAPQDTADKILDYFWNDGKWYDIGNGYVSLQRMIGIVDAAMGAVAYEESERFAMLYHKLGYIYDDLGAYDKALEYYFKALAISETVLGTEHPDTATTYNNIGSVYWKRSRRDDYDKALEYYFKALAIREKVLGTEHPDTANSYNNIGWVYKALGDYDKALEYYFKDLAISEKVLGAAHPSIATSYNNIGGVYYDKGDYGKALGYDFKALAIMEKVLGGEHPYTAQSYSNIGLVYKEQGDYDKALEYLNKAYLIYGKTLGPNHPSTNNVLEWINITTSISRSSMQKLPIGIQSFESLRKDKCAYVDKTKLVFDLINDAKYVFLSRPRRFGKSLFMSTLKAYFEGKKELFDGLAISKLEKEWESFPILYLDLNVGMYDSTNGLLETLHSNLNEW